MKKYLLLLCVGVGLMTAACDSAKQETTNQETTETVNLNQAYICPMKCDASDKPGKCGVCEMDLVENPDFKPAADTTAQAS